MAQSKLSIPFCLIFLTGCIFLFSATVGRAQVTSGAILGNITDPKGAAIMNAKVTITNTATGAIINAVTTRKGSFELPSLPNGPYRVNVDAPGFKTGVRDGIQLNIGQQYRVDIKLEIGQPEQKVVVEASSQVLRTEASQLSTTIDERTIVEMPNVNRNPLLNTSLVAGVVTTGSFLDPNNVNTGDNARQNFSSFVVNGSAPLTSNIQLDGANDTSPYANEIIVMPNIESLAESNVVTNAYSAEYGRTAGGVINFTTKSGSNTLHGALYENYRNTDLDANSYGNNYFGDNPNGSAVRPKAPFNSNLFGAALGGPVRFPWLYNGRDKTFFFTSYEGLRRVQGQSTYYTVPTALERHGDFSQTKTLVSVNGTPTALPVNVYLPLPNTTSTTQVAPGQYQVNRQQASYQGVPNVIPPQYLDPAAQQFVNFYPMPNITPVLADGTENYFINASTTINSDQLIVRLDQNFSQSRRGFFRWTTDWTLNDPPNIYATTNPAANNDGPTTQFNPSATLGYDWAITPKNLVELRFNVSRLNLVLNPSNGGADTNFGALGFAANEQVGLPTKSFPSITDGAYPTMGLQGFAYRGNHTTLLSFTPNYTRLFSNWSMKVGGEYQDILYNFTQPWVASMAFSSTLPTFSQACEGTGCPVIPVNMSQGWSPANFLLGANDGLIGNGEYVTGDPTEALKNGYWAIYDQNDWKATRKLTLNLGVRWEYQGPITDRYNRLSQFNLNATNETGAPGLYQFSGVNGDPRTQVNSNWKNWSPRVGFAYRAHPNTVVSGAYGISYVMTTGAGSGAQGFGSDGFSAPAFIQIRPDSGLDILNAPWTNAFKSGGVTAGANPQNPVLLGQNVTAVIRTDNATPYIQQWNFAVQQQLPSETILQIAYVGTKGTHLQIQQQPLNSVNQIPQTVLSNALNTYVSTGVNPLTTLVNNPYYGVISGNANLDNPTIQQQYLDEPYPTYGNVTKWFGRTGSSNYNALQLSINRAFRNGFQLTGTYTWSKNIDFGTAYGAAVQSGSTAGSAYFAPGNRRLDRSVSDFDQAHRAVISSLWALPFGKGHRFLKDTPVATQILGGWQISGIATLGSGFPLAISGTGFGRPNLIADPRLSPRYRVKGPATVVLPTGQTYSVQAGYKLLFNPYAYQASVLNVPNPSGGANLNVANPYYYGSAPRLQSDLRGPGIENFDLSLSKTYPITSRINFAVRLDAFNAFNRAQPGLPDTNFNLPNLSTPGQIGYSTSDTFGLVDLQTAQTAIGTSENAPRYVQLSGRISW